MPENAALSIAFESTESAVAAPDIRVRLEAESDGTAGSRPNLNDIDAMVARAASGMSARTVIEERCRAARYAQDGSIVVRMAVLVWPSRADLRYTLDLPEEATPGPVTVLREERSYKTWTSGGGMIEMPWRMESAVPAWAYGCWDAQSRAIPGPALRHDQARIIVEGERARDVHGIVAVSGAAVGFRHQFSLIFGRVDDEGRPVRVTDLGTVPVTARWTGADGEEETATLELPVPECAKSLLAECPDGSGVFKGRAREAAKGVYEVAYSACDGRMLAYRKVEAAE